LQVAKNSRFKHIIGG